VNFNNLQPPSQLNQLDFLFAIALLLLVLLLVVGVENVPMICRQIRKNAPIQKHFSVYLMKSQEKIQKLKLFSGRGDFSFTLD